MKTHPHDHGKGHRRTADAAAAEIEHVPIRHLPIVSLIPSPENDRLYRPVDPDDPGIRALAESIAERGVLEPLVVTSDRPRRYIVSGHRRLVAARLAGLDKVPCRIERIKRNGDHDAFVLLLAEHNRQRVKSIDEQLREEVVAADPDVAYQGLIEFREARAEVTVGTMTIRPAKLRATISEAKWLMLGAVIQVINDRRTFWPLSDRSIHYALQNDPPLIHASKPDSVYRNDLRSYKALCDLLTRARLEGHIAWESIADPTRPVSLWRVYNSPADYLRQEIDGFLRRGWRNLMRSQPNHIEIVAEKMTIGPIVERVAARFTIPTTIGRGYCSLQARAGRGCRLHPAPEHPKVGGIATERDLAENPQQRNARGPGGLWVSVAASPAAAPRQWNRTRRRV